MFLLTSYSVGNYVSKKNNMFPICSLETFREGFIYKELLITGRTEVEKKDNSISKSQFRIFSDVDLLE